MKDKLHIVIDARLYGPKHTGIGRYTKNLLVSLSQLKSFSDYNFTAIIYPELQNEIRRDLEDKFNLVTTNIRHYSLNEQINFPTLIYSLNPDLVHFTNSYKPFLYFGKSIVTVHDLIRHFSKGTKTTTKQPWAYWPKYLGYLLITWYTIKTCHLIVPSNYWRQYIINHFYIEPEKITTTYEAIDPEFLTIPDSLIQNPKPYVIYTGNLYPHKNIDVILKALKSIPEIKLKIISARSVFSKRIDDLVDKYNIQTQVQSLGYVKDKDFRKIYQQALCLIHPAFIEGFSLTGLEAMALNCPVISSNTSCLPEIYQNAVLYFNPQSESELTKQIISLQTNKNLRYQLIAKGKKLISQYSWNKTAATTFSVYQQCLK